MLTFQDFEAASTDMPAFIMKAIEEYKNNAMFRTAEAAQKYDDGENVEILKRMTYLQKHGIVDSKVKFHKLCSGFFPKFVRQENQYLLGNGVTLPGDVKKKLGPRFDNALQKAGMQALVDGVNWGYWNHDRLVVFRATEFVPLLDEMTSDLRAGIRFFQIDDEKPLYVELFEEDGLTKYSRPDEDSRLVEIESKQAYKQTIRRDAVSSEVIGSANYERIPVFPLWANDKHKSEFTLSIKSLIDAYDFIASDLVDGITMIEGLYWVFTNFGGNDMAELVQEVQELHATYADDAKSKAEKHTVEIPYQAKQVALDLLEKQLHTTFMALDMKALTGGSLTNVAINVAKTDFDLKVDIFEWQCADFVQNILEIIGITGAEPKFKRRSITNDTENIQNIYTFREDIDHETALQLNPMIPDEDVSDILDRLAKEQLGYDEESEDDDNGGAVSPAETIEDVEDIAGKTLNGAQTQSLIAVIGQYSAGQITLGQAVNIISVAIGVTKDEARKIIEGLD